MTKKILITGANGQLGHEMRNALKGNNRFECIFTDVAELDICNTEAVKQTMANNHRLYRQLCRLYPGRQSGRQCRTLQKNQYRCCRKPCSRGCRLRSPHDSYLYRLCFQRKRLPSLYRRYGPRPAISLRFDQTGRRKNIDRHLSRKHYHSHSMVILPLWQQFCQNHAAFRRRTGGVIGRHAHLCRRPRTSNPCHTASGYIRAGNIPFLRRRGMQLV